MIEARLRSWRIPGHRRPGSGCRNHEPTLL